MPKLLKCVVCNGTVSSDAIKCPHCGTFSFMSAEQIKKEYEERVGTAPPIRYDPATLPGKSHKLQDLLDAVSHLSVGDKVLCMGIKYDDNLKKDIYADPYIGIITSIEPAKFHWFRNTELPKVYVKKIGSSYDRDVIYERWDVVCGKTYFWPKKLIES